MLIDTLNDLLQTTRGKRGHLTVEILQFNHRIAHEIIAASDEKCLLEYLGMKILESQKVNSP